MLTKKKKLFKKINLVFNLTETPSTNVFTCLPPPFPPPSEFRWKVSSGKVRGNKVGTVEMRAVLWPTLRTAPEGKVYLDGRKEERSMGSRRTSAALVNASWLPWAPTFPHPPPPPLGRGPPVGCTEQNRVSSPNHCAPNVTEAGRKRKARWEESKQSL